MKLTKGTVSALARQFRRQAQEQVDKMEKDFEQSLEVQQEAKMIHGQLRGLPKDFLDAQMSGDIECYSVARIAQILREQRFAEPQRKSCEEIEDEIMVQAVRVAEVRDIAINPFKK